MQPPAGRKSEWAGWKPGRGPHETTIWCFSQSWIWEEQVHLGREQEGRKRTGTGLFKHFIYLFNFLLLTYAQSASCSTYFPLFLQVFGAVTIHEKSGQELGKRKEEYVWESVLNGCPRSLADAKGCFIVTVGSSRAT